MKKKSLSKVIAGVAAITVITLLVLAGTASAFSINLGSLSNSNPTINDVITATSSIEIQSNERVDIREINLGFAGTPERLCIFDVDGNPISGCDGITIIRTG